MNKFLFGSLAAAFVTSTAMMSIAAEPSVVNFQYAPEWWQTLICLGDDPQKTLVGKDGGLLYDYLHEKGPYQGFNTEVMVQFDPALQWDHQELESPRIPIVKTFWKEPGLEVEEDAFAAPVSAAGSLPSCDVLLARVTNTGTESRAVTPSVIVRRNAMLDKKSDLQDIIILKRRLTLSSPVVSSVASNPDDPKAIAQGWFHDDQLVQKLDAKHCTGTVAQAAPITLAPGQTAEFAVACGTDAPITLEKAHQLRDAAVAYWNQLKLPYGHVTVPDPGIQALLDGCLRNIWQAREIKKGLPSFQVGPTVYRGLWAIDGAFILETVTMLDDVTEARAGMNYYLSQEKPDGSFQMLKGHNKENGIALWAATHHARLTADKAWLESVWPNLEKTIHHIADMNKETLADPTALDYNLMPPGFIDGGLEQGPKGEYSTVYWTLIGLKAAAEAATWLGKDAEAAQIRAQYDAMAAQFHKTAAHDMVDDGHGNKCLPMAMGNAVPKVKVQRGQWPFCHAVYPGQLFEPNDPVLAGNMAMLKATEKEGMVIGTGWNPTGSWNYFASFYAHAWLWLGDGHKAWECLVAFANHASPLGVWREEQNLIGQPFSKIGDMPHNWASAEFIRLTIHLLAVDKGDTLHLLEGMPAEWLQPGKDTRLDDIRTIFGPVTLRVSTAGGVSHLHMDPLPASTDCKKVIVHFPDGTTRDFAPPVSGPLEVDLK